MATTATVPTTTRPAVQYRVRRVLSTNIVTGEVCSVPDLRFTLADVQACVTHREISGTVQLYCQTCGESVADCIELAPQLRDVPADWSWQYHAEEV